MPWCINTGKSLIPLTLRFFAQKRNLLIPLELSRVMHQGSDEVAVPAQKRSGCGNGRNLGQRLAAQSLGLDREPAPVVVREPETLAPKPGSEHTDR